MTFTVYASQAEDVKKRLDRLAKKAAGYSIPFSYIMSDVHPETVCVWDTGYGTGPSGAMIQMQREVGRYTVEAVDFDIECEDLIRANGWTLRAKVEHGEAGNIVSAIGNKSVEHEWYTTPAHCEHCKTNRFRAVTYFCENESGEVRQVGRTCLRDYTGINPATAAMWAEVRDVFDKEFAIKDCDEDEWKEHSSSMMYDVERVLAYAYDAIKEFGYRKSGELGSTRDVVTERTCSYGSPSTEGKEKASAICKWLAGLDEKARATDAALNALRDEYNGGSEAGDGKYWSKYQEINDAWDVPSDLERNCISLALSGYATTKHFGRLAYMPVAYEQYMERKARAEQREAERATAVASSKYVGTVGKRLTIKTESAKLVTSWEGYYGVTFLYRFVDADGNVYVWRASKSIEVRDGMTIKGTVKEHSEYKGIKQTVVTRCAVA